MTNWRTQGLLKLLENVLDVGENREKLIVYAALGKAARNMESYKAIVDSLNNLKEAETLIIQSGKPICVLKTHKKAPVVIMANCNMVGHFATPENFYDLVEKDLICWGGLTAGAWQYIGSQGVIQGTYEIFSQIAQRYFNGDLRKRFILTAGLGGMGGAQPLAGVLANAIILTVDIDQSKIDKRIARGYLQMQANSLAHALELIEQAKKDNKSISIGLLGNAASVYEEIYNMGIIPDIVTDQTSAHDLIYGYVPYTVTLEESKKLQQSDPKKLYAESQKSVFKHVQAMLNFQKAGSVVFDNGNLIRSQAHDAGLTNAFDIPVFTEAYLRPLFARAIGPFRWVALSGNKEDIYKIDDYILKNFTENKSIINWIKLAKENIPFEGLPARIAWLGHLERTNLALKVNQMVANGTLSGPVAFSRDHLDAGAMTHPKIMTENMKDGSDIIADWPLINAMVHCASQADLVAIHSGGGGYSGYMTSSGVTIIADGTDEASERLNLSLTNDTTLGVVRYADAGYEESFDEIEKKSINYINLSK